MNDLRSCALITGASLGLGRAFALECAARGMDLLLVALPGEGLPALAASIERDRGVVAEWIEADLTEDGSVGAVMARARERRLDLGLLVNNAGVGGVGLFTDVPLDRHEDAVLLNVLALVRLTRLVVDEFRGGGRLRVLNVASLGAFFPMPTLSVYSATKSFVRDFSLALRAELDGEVGVSVLCPNAIRTNASVDDYASGLGLAARLACMAPEDIARVALDGLDRGLPVIVPGRFNRLLAALSRIAPRALVSRTVRRYWGGYAAIDAATMAGESSDGATSISRGRGA